MNSDLNFILIASFGSAVQEIIHLYDIRKKLHLPSFLKIFKSSSYWTITSVMIVASGIGTWILYGKDLNINSVIFILGAAFPIIFKKLVAGSTHINQSAETKLGHKAPETPLEGFTLNDYFK